MKSLVRKLLPQFLLNNYRRFNRHKWQRQNRSKSVEQVFTGIYEKNRWGGSRGEFCSGSGTDNEQIVSAYISMISEQASSKGFLVQVSQIPRRFASGPADEIPPVESIVERCWRP